MRLHIPHVHEVSVVIIQSNIGTLVGVGPWSDIVRVTGDSFPCGRYWFSTLRWNKEGNKDLMAIRDRPTANRFPTAIRFTKVELSSLDLIPINGRLRWSPFLAAKSLLLSCGRSVLIVHRLLHKVKGLLLIKLQTLDFNYATTHESMFQRVISVLGILA